jgi:hypothetical protein
MNFHKMLPQVKGLSERQKEEINIIESVIGINSENKEEVRKLVRTFHENGAGSLPFIFMCIGHAAMIRPRERESQFHLLHTILCDFNVRPLLIFEPVLRNMLKVKGIYPKEDDFTNEHIFDFAKEGTIARSIYDDDVETLRLLLATPTEETLSIEPFSPIR